MSSSNGKYPEIEVQPRTHCCTFAAVYKRNIKGGCERRRQRKHLVYPKLDLLAVRPNEVWSWDITKLRGPAYQ